jgi:23S rRNA (guanosine2251-2'-O)-methyltransferase
MNLIIGRKPVLEAINSGEQIDQVYILYGQKGPAIDAIRIASKKMGVKCNEIPYEKLKAITSHLNLPTGQAGAQGVAAFKLEQKFYSLGEIISTAQKSAYPLILILDSIQDTHNVGAILRTADCSGVDGVIITKHNSAPINATVAKTSAGASEHVKMCVVNNLAQAMKELKDKSFWIAGSSLDNSKDYTSIDYRIPLALIVGNEEKGIRKLTANNCDFLINIPMKGKIQSLNVSVATGIFLFEIMRQRK